MPTGVQEPKLWRFGDFLSNSLVVPYSLGSLDPLRDIQMLDLSFKLAVSNLTWTVEIAI